MDISVDRPKTGGYMFGGGEGFVILIGIVAVIFQIIMIAICANLADSQGRNSLLWGLMGLTLGSIAVLALLCLEDRVVRRKTTGTAGQGSIFGGENKGPTAIPTVKQYDSMRCPECGESFTTAMCPYCGYKRK